MDDKYDSSGYYCEDCDEWHFWLDPNACHMQFRKKAGKLANERAAKELKTLEKVVSKKVKGPTITIEMLSEEVCEILSAYFKETIPKFPTEGNVQFHTEDDLRTYVFTITPPGDYWK